MFVYSLLLALLWNANAFQSFTKSVGYPRRHNSHLYLVDPITLNVGVAVFSAAAGMASQQPKIQLLETELEVTKKTLSEVRILHTSTVQSWIQIGGLVTHLYRSSHISLIDRRKHGRQNKNLGRSSLYVG